MPRAEEDHCGVLGAAQRVPMPHCGGGVSAGLGWLRSAAVVWGRAGELQWGVLVPYPWAEVGCCAGARLSVSPVPGVPGAARVPAALPGPCSLRVDRASPCNARAGHRPQPRPRRDLPSTTPQRKRGRPAMPAQERPCRCWGGRRGARADGGMRGGTEGCAEGCRDARGDARRDAGLQGGMRGRMEGRKEGCAERWRHARRDRRMRGGTEGCAERRLHRLPSPSGDAPAAAQGAAPAGGAAAGRGRSPRAKPPRGGPGASALPGDRAGKSCPSLSAGAGPPPGAGPQQPLGSLPPRPRAGFPGHRAGPARCSAWSRPAARGRPALPAPRVLPALHGRAAAAAGRWHRGPAWYPRQLPAPCPPASPAAGVLPVQAEGSYFSRLCSFPGPNSPRPQSCSPEVGCHYPLVFIAELAPSPLVPSCRARGVMPLWLARSVRSGLFHVPCT